MEGGPPCFPRDSPCPAVLGSSRHGGRLPFAYGALTPYGRPSQVVRLDRGPTRGSHRSRRAIPSTPRRHRRWAVPPPRFGLRPFRSPLLRASRLISCPRGTEMFQFPRCASAPPMCSADGDGTPSRRVPPFGHPRIKACVRLPEAFRSLPRPSSAQGTEASTVRPSLPLGRPPRAPPRSARPSPPAHARSRGRACRPASPRGSGSSPTTAPPALRRFPALPIAPGTPGSPDMPCLFVPRALPTRTIPARSGSARCPSPRVLCARLLPSALVKVQPFGGHGRNRTADLLLAKQALCPTELRPQRIRALHAGPRRRRSDPNGRNT